MSAREWALHLVATFNKKLQSSSSFAFSRIQPYLGWLDLKYLASRKRPSGWKKRPTNRIKFSESNFNEQRSTVFVADEGDTLAGFTQLYPALCSVDMEPFYVLYDLFVDPGSRRAGIGRALMNTAADWARTQGACRIDLETAHSNVIGQGLYESLGYKQDRVFRKYSLDLAR